MTADNDNPHLLEGEDTSPENSASASARAKKSPVRKVTKRPKVSAVTTSPELAEAAAPAEVEAPAAEETAKPRRSRKKADKETAAAEVADQAPELIPATTAENETRQARVLSPVEVKDSPAPEAQVETRVIPPEVMTQLEKRTEENFPHSQAPVEAPAAKVEHSAPVRNESPAAAAQPSADLVATSATSPEAGQEKPPAPAENAAPVAPAPFGAPANEGRNAYPAEEQRRHDNRDQQFQGRRGDHRQHGRGDFQQRGDYQQGRGGGQQGFRHQGDRHGGGGGGGQERQERQDRQDRQQQQPHGGQQQPPSQQQPGGGGDMAVSRVVEPQFGEGIIEVSGKGFGFLREAKRNFVQTPADIFVTPEVCRKYNLRDGQWIKGEIRRSSRGPQLFRLTALNGEDAEKFRTLPNFDELTSINPKKRIKLETVPDRYTTRVMDLMTPIGKGQRGLIVAPPRTGKTTLLQHIAEAVVKNHPEIKLIILLVDERPEEVTEIRRSVPQAEVMASSNDSDLKSHTRIAQLAIERAKRLVEAGQDVFILLDSITRMARAFNNAMSGGRGTQSGGLAVGALEIPRKIFAAARNTEEAGSLTIMATALIETNSKMDDAIFQEFKGTGNMELVLDRKISDQRIYPAVDIFLSGTRREELLLQGWELDKINVIRRGLAGHKPIEAIERLLSFLKKFPTNTQMLASLPG